MRPIRTLKDLSADRWALLQYGEREGRRPNPLFDPVWYCATYPDIEGSIGGSLGHYLQYGEREGRRPNPLFDPVWYCATYPDIEGFIGGSLGHYLQHGEREGRRPNPLFDPVWYATTYAQCGARYGQALAHYLENHNREHVDPAPEFDSSILRMTTAPAGASSRRDISPLEQVLDRLRTASGNDQLPTSLPWPQYDEEQRQSRLSAKLAHLPTAVWAR